jgi:hypothetical protein
VGPLESSLGGSKWILAFIDDFSRMALHNFLNLKIKYLVSLRISKQRPSWRLGGELRLYALTMVVQILLIFSQNAE